MLLFVSLEDKDMSNIRKRITKMLESDITIIFFLLLLFFVLSVLGLSSPVDGVGVDGVSFVSGPFPHFCAMDDLFAII